MAFQTGLALPCPHELNGTTMTSFEYDTGVPGPTILLLGAVHGNEPGGTLAIQRVLKEIGTELSITRGKIIAVPVVNEAARDAGERYVDKDLNRHMTLNEPLTTNEGRLAHILAPLYEQADVVMDLHSFAAEDGDPSVFVDFPHDEAIELGRQTLSPFMIVGWQEVYEGRDGKFTGDTLTFAEEHGAIALTYEGGSHTDLETPNRMYDAVKNCLIGQGMLEGELQRNPEQQVVRVHEAFFMDPMPSGNVPTAAEQFTHMQFVEEGTPLVMDGEAVLKAAPAGGCYVMFPPPPPEDNKRKPGDHLMYIGLPESPEFALAAE